MKPVVLLDRDGTIIAEKHYLHNPAEVELLPGAVNSLLLLQQNGFEIIILTNQSGIGRGFYSTDDMHAVNKQLCRLLTEAGVKISPRRIYHCPHAPAAACLCRKPQIGLAKQAQTEWLFDLKRGYVIGDKSDDIELGHNLNLPAILVKTGHGLNQPQNVFERAAFVAEDLADAARWIVIQASPHC